MSTLYVSWGGGVSNNCLLNPSKTETIDTSATSAQSGTNPNAAVVQLFSDAAHYVAVGASPTATTSNGTYVPANQLYYLSLAPGHRIAARTV